MASYKEYYALREPSFYVEHPRVDELTRNDFSRKFRLPYETFYALYEEMKHDDFMRERSMAVPLKIKLLASLRYLALGESRDAMEDIVNVSRRTLRTWFHGKFLPWMMKHKYHERVKYPTTSDELAVLMDPWTRAGFPGCIGCVDGVHIPWGGYRAGRKYMYVGKEEVPTLGFNVTIDYDGRIIFCSDRQRGSANDWCARAAAALSNHNHCGPLWPSPVDLRRRRSVPSEAACDSAKSACESSSSSTSGIRRQIRSP